MFVTVLLLLCVVLDEKGGSVTVLMGRRKRGCPEVFTGIRKNCSTTMLMDLNLRKKLIKCYIWSMDLYGAEIWTLRAADQKYLESFEMWCWRRLKISWTDHMRNECVT